MGRAWLFLCPDRDSNGRHGDRRGPQSTWASHSIETRPELEGSETDAATGRLPHSLSRLHRCAPCEPFVWCFESR